MARPVMELEKAKARFASCRTLDVEGWYRYLTDAPEGVWHSLVAEVIKAAVATEADERRIGRRPKPNVSPADVRRIMEGSYSEDPFPTALKALLNGRSVRAFATRAHIDHKYLSRLLSGERSHSPSVSTMVSIAQAAKVSPAYFLEYRIAAVQELVANAMTSRPALSVSSYKRIHEVLG
jgi:hypothetical protein